jgi:hypothetical protein
MPPNFLKITKIQRDWLSLISKDIKTTLFIEKISTVHKKVQTSDSATFDFFNSVKFFNTAPNPTRHGVNTSQALTEPEKIATNRPKRQHVRLFSHFSSNCRFLRISAKNRRILTVCNV